MLYDPRGRLEVRSRFEIRGWFEVLIGGQPLGVDLGRPVADVVASDPAIFLLVELLRTLTVLQVCLVVEGFDAIVVVDVRKALAGIVASGALVVLELLIAALQVRIERRLAELLRVLVPGRGPT